MFFLCHASIEPTLTTPTNGATGVPINQNIRITFHAPIDPGTFQAQICTTTDYLDNNNCDTSVSIGGIGSFPGLNFIDLVSVGTSQYATSYTIVVEDARLVSDTSTPLLGLPFTFSFTTESEPVRTWYFKASDPENPLWSHTNNWWSNPDGTGTNPSIQSPWVNNDSYTNDNLTLATGETIAPIIDVEIGDGFALSGTCDISNVILRNAFLHAGTFSGDNFVNKSTIEGGLFQNPHFRNEGTINEGEWDGGTFVHTNGSHVSLNAPSFPRRVLYFGGTEDDHWDNVANWYNDATFLDPADIIPDVNIEAVVMADVRHNSTLSPEIAKLTVRGAGTVFDIDMQVIVEAHFEDTSLFGIPESDRPGDYDVAELFGNVYFTESSVNHGVILETIDEFISQATFRDSSSNHGAAFDAYFYQSSTNEGSLLRATFFGDTSENNGIIMGQKYRIYDDMGVFSTTRNFALDGPWIVLAENDTWVNVSGAVYDVDGLNDNDTLFDSSPGSGFVFMVPTTLYYNNEQLDGDWGNISNWWSDPEFTIQADVLPTVFDDAVLYAPVEQNSTESDIIVDDLTVHGSGSYENLGDIPFFMVDVRVLGTATFENYAVFGHPFTPNYNTLTGNAVFDNSLNLADIVGNVTFRGANSGNIGHVNGNAHVYSPAPNPIITDENDGTISGTITYYDYSPRTFYYNNATHDGDWNTLGNWWLNEEFTDPADSLPRNLDSVHISGYDMTTNSGPDPSISYLYFIGDEHTFSLDITVSQGAYFEGLSAFTGTLAGNVGFHDNSFNNGNIGASAWFHDNAFNGQDGIIGGSGYYYGENTENMSLVDDTPDHTRVYESADFVVTRDFVTDGPWTVIVDDGTVDISGAVYDNQTILIEQGGGRFIGLEHFYFNAAINNDWNTLGNWWMDEEFSIPATELPGIHDRVYSGFDILTNTGEIPSVRDIHIDSAQFNISVHLSSRAEFYGDAHFTGEILTEELVYFYDSSVNSGEINSDTRFYDNSYNIGTVNGSVRFYDDSYNRGTVTGRGRFYDSSYNHAEGHVINDEDNTGRFRDESINYGIVEGEEVQFEDIAKNLGEVIGNAHFEGDLYDYDGIPENRGTITGTKTFTFYTSGEYIVEQDFLESDWTLIAYEGVIDLRKSAVHPDTTFEESGGIFIYSEGQIFYYDNREMDGDWNNLGNWWMNGGFSESALALPGEDDVVIINASLTQNSGDTPRVRQIHMPGESTTSVNIDIEITQKAVFRGDATLGTTEDAPTLVRIGEYEDSGPFAYFYNASKNYGQIDGTAIFFQEARNHGSLITGYFSDSSLNTVDGSITGTTLASEFMNNAVNEGTISGKAYFYDNAYNKGTLDSGQFYNNSFNHAQGVIMGTREEDTTSFYGDETENYGTIYGPKYRIYQNDYEGDTYMITRDFISDGPWIIQAYAIRVNVVDAQYDANTVFEEYSEGVFIYPCNDFGCGPDFHDEEDDEPDVVQSTGSGSVFFDTPLLTLIFETMVTDITHPQEKKDVPELVSPDNQNGHVHVLLSAHDFQLGKTLLSLHRKNNSQDVIGLQNFLNLYQNAGLHLTGIYDKKTKEAVENFQRKYADEILVPQGLTKPTGNVGVLTMTKILSLLGNDILSGSLSDKVMTGSNYDPFEVVKLQKFLNKHEGESILVHGFFDAATRSAVNRFQLKYAAEILSPWGLKNPTGNVGTYTRKKINSMIAAHADK